MSKNIILLSGWKRSGKTESAEYLKENYKVKPYALADALKNSVSEKYKIPRILLDNEYKEKWLPDLPAHLDSSVLANSIYNEVKSELALSSDDEDKTSYFTPRALCILEGGFMRAINPNHWVDIVAKQIQQSESSTFVISDFRFKNEYNRFVELFGKHNVITVRINRYDDINTQSPSERELDDFVFDNIIENRKDLDYLHTQLDVIINKEFNGRWL